MITRIGAVVLSILSAVWLARTPDWEPLIALLTSFGSYLGIEIAQRRATKSSVATKGHEEKKGKIESQEEEAIILHIAKYGARESEELASEMGISKIRSQYLSERLYAKGFIDYPSAWIDRCPYYLTQKGRAHLIKKGLVT